MFFPRVRVGSTSWILPKVDIVGGGLILRILPGIISAALHLASTRFFTPLVGMGSGLQTER